MKTKRKIIGRKYSLKAIMEKIKIGKSSVKWAKVKLSGPEKKVLTVWYKENISKYKKDKRTLGKLTNKGRRTESDRQKVIKLNTNVTKFRVVEGILKHNEIL